MTRTQVTIIGAGPSGLLLGQLLHREGIDSIVLERRSREYCEARIRAGLLEPGTVALLRRAGASDRMDREGLIHDGVNNAFGSRVLRVDVKQLAKGSECSGFAQLGRSCNSAGMRSSLRVSWTCRVEDRHFSSKMISPLNSGLWGWIIATPVLP
jgi:2-polyprenyl-6-methoxyphenol hydroxylase-like FAD-dependent oxidoreductase